ncbi:TPA: ribose 5-phosphate isomerase B [bacterium]|nr:ribose 5-phosphate isomerase B [bacterium]
MVIALGSDHAGFYLKEKIKAYLSNKGFEAKDFGTDSDKPCDYPDYAKQVAGAILKEKYHFGILICGTGIGMSIAANRIPGIRAALCYTEEFAHLARKHNWANILCLSGRFLKEKDACKIVDAFLSSQPEDRHRMRIEKLG